MINCRKKLKYALFYAVVKNNGLYKLMNNVKTKRYIQHYIKNFNTKTVVYQLNTTRTRTRKKNFLLLIVVYSKQKCLPKKK